MAFCLALGLAAGAADVAALAQDQTPRQSDAAPPTADVPPAAVPGAAPRILTAPPAAQATAPETPRQPSVDPVANQTARFQFIRVGDTVLKLDGDTGAVAVCHAGGADWTCQALPEGRLALDKEIGRLGQQIDRLDGAIDPVKRDVAALRDEITTLKSGLTASQAARSVLKDEVGALKAEIDSLRSEIGAVKLALPPPPPPSPPPSERPSVELRMPTAEDYERACALAAGAVSDAWRRLVEMIAQVQSDMMRKG
ncbi:MAG: hypothetical protein AB7T86_03150 [Xanthobacteraceae bacterium]